MNVKPVCGKCVHYEPKPGRRAGFCTNPRASQFELMVQWSRQAADRCFAKKEEEQE